MAALSITTTPIEASMVATARLCMTPGCTNPKDARKICGTCRARAQRLGLWNPKFPQGVEDLERMQELWKERLRTNAPSRAATARVARIGLPNNLGQRSTPTCRWPGCERVGDHSGWCDRDSKRIVTCGLAPDVEPAVAEEAWERRTRLREAASASGTTLEAHTRLYEVAQDITAEVGQQVLPNRKEVPAPVRRPDPEANDPLQQIRVILGCDPDGADQEVVDRARMFVAFRDGVELAVNASGISGYLLLEDLVTAVKGIAGERDRYRAEVVNAHVALDAMPSTVAPDCPTPADRIRYATTAWRSEREEASNLATLCQDAHAALNAAGTPNEGTPADRIRRLVADQELRRLQWQQPAERLERNVRAALGKSEATEQEIIAGLQELQQGSVPQLLQSELWMAVGEPDGLWSASALVRRAVERLNASAAESAPAPAPPHGAFRLVVARLDDSGRVVLRLEQDDGREAPDHVPVGALVALQVVGERGRR